MSRTLLFGQTYNLTMVQDIYKSNGSLQKSLIQNIHVTRLNTCIYFLVSFSKV